MVRRCSRAANLSAAPHLQVVQIDCLTLASLLEAECNPVAGAWDAVDDLDHLAGSGGAASVAAESRERAGCRRAPGDGKGDQASILSPERRAIACLRVKRRALPAQLLHTAARTAPQRPIGKSHARLHVLPSCATIAG